jgi:hypothetical protein
MEMFGLRFKTKRMAIGVAALPVAALYLVALVALLPFAILNLLGALAIEYRKQCAFEKMLKETEKRIAIEKTKVAIAKSKKIVKELIKPKTKSKKKK